MDRAENQKLIDLDDGLNRVRGNKVIYKKMLGMFLNGSDYDSLCAHIESGDYENAHHAAHALKGVTGNLSLSLLFEQSTQLMNQLKEGAFDQQLFSDFQQAYGLTVEEVKRLVETL